MKTSELHEWLKTTTEPQLELSPGARIPAFLPDEYFPRVPQIGFRAYTLCLAAKRHAERGHTHRIMINRGAETIADGIPTDYPELAGWEELTFDEIPAQIAAWGKVGV